MRGFRRNRGRRKEVPENGSVTNNQDGTGTKTPTQVGGGGAEAAVS
jgi:hypothetical protein